jgi:DtxR family Mn-dependent transcriptional regulator
MLKKLSEEDLIKYEPYKGSALTIKGRREAQKILRKHRLLENFLTDILHIGKDKVHSQACEMEHALSDEAEESLCRLLKHPDRCSDDGNTIPACDLPFESCDECIALHSKGLEEVGKRKENLLALSELKNGDSGKIQFIRGGHSVLQRLLDMGLTPELKLFCSKLPLSKDLLKSPFEAPNWP